MRFRLLALAVALLQACGGGGAGQPCTTSAECPSDQRCVNNECVDAVRTDGGPDVRDAAMDGGADSGADVGMDTAMDSAAAMDAITAADSAVDAATDSAMDAATDSAMDAAADAGCDGGCPGCPTDETCNGLDDNCDGTADEGLVCGETCSDPLFIDAPGTYHYATCSNGVDTDTDCTQGHASRDLIIQINAPTDSHTVRVAIDSVVGFLAFRQAITTDDCASLATVTDCVSGATQNLTGATRYFIHASGASTGDCGAINMTISW